MTFPDDAQWAILQARVATPWYYAVLTTGIVCKSGCPAHTPLRANVRMFASYDTAIVAGFRACKRCQPNTDQPVSRAKASIAAVPSLELP